MNLTAGTRLGPYEILAPIGSGGMGEVWKARDTRLGRIVAIKKVREQHSERFKQEARTIAALNHPHICQLFDIGPDYLVLEYVEGKALSSPLPEKDAVRLAIQIATALEAAHKKGIIHRDLKPANIMVTNEGSVKLLDFGLAKLYEQHASPGSVGVPPALSTSPTVDFPPTQSGAVLGTVAYMSPEQALGQPADARSDIFSFGLVLYEMLSGRKAFRGNSTPEIMAALLRDEPSPIQTSASLEKIIQRCLAKQPSGRYQTMAEVRNALDQAGTKPMEQPSIAVLPFVNMSGDKEQEYFSDGLAEEIINALTQIPRLKVIARTSAFAFKGKQEDITKIAEALRVSTILEGSVRKAGNRIRITAQLITAADGSHLWSERYDREMADVFAVQDEISQAIAEKLRVHLSGDHPLVKQPTKNVEAYNLNLKGRHHFSKITPEGLARGKECFERAIELDPNYASPWHGLAAICHVSGILGILPSRIANEQSRQAALKALDLDRMLPEAHAQLAVLLASEFDWKGAESEFLRALEVGSGSQDVWQLYAYSFLIPLRRTEEALAAMRRAEELNPLSPIIQAGIAGIYTLMRQYDEAIAHCAKALELDSHSFLASVTLGSVHIHKGELNDGIRIIEAAVSSLGNIPALQGALVWVYAAAGRTREAYRLLEELLITARNAHVPAFWIAWAYSGFGEIEECLNWLHKGAEERESNIVQVFLFPGFDHLRSHPRYHDLLRKMNLEP